ncbi:hypothetical protein ACFLXB_09680 [Chloroflexota bacterium]
MTNNSAEQERLRRLRDKQLADRDPHIKQRQYNRTYSGKAKKKSSEKLSLKEMWSDIPHIIKSPFYGLVLGLLVLWFLPQYWLSEFAVPVSVGCIVLFITLGVLIGNALDLRDKLKDLSN